MGMLDTIDAIFSECKGILAADESTGTAEKRLASVGVQSTPESRHSYRHNLFSSPGISAHVGGVILFDETIRSSQTIEPLRAQNIELGIKVDKGATRYNKQSITEGLDGLTERLLEYVDMGASFAKWRAVLGPNSSIENIKTNSTIMAVYAKRCQDVGVVPIVEPEVLMDGCHTIGTSYNITSLALKELFSSLTQEKVRLDRIILKPNMVVTGYSSSVRSTAQEVARMTTDCLKNNVPASVPAIAFLSGGQKDSDVLEALAAINEEFYLPWTVSFSFGRTLQRGALELWSQERYEEARTWLSQRAKECCFAVSGRTRNQSGQTNMGVAELWDSGL